MYEPSSMLGRSVRYPALMLAGGVSAALIVSDATPQPIQAAASVLLVLGLLGPALSFALVPSPRLEGVERVAFSLGIGLATLIVDGFIINASREGMSRSNWAISLGVITIVAAGLGGIRERAAASHNPVDDSSDWRETPWRLTRTWSGAPAVAMLTAAGLVVAAFIVATVGLHNQPRPGFTELWLLPSASASSLTVGLSNHELADETYVLDVATDDAPVATWDALSLARGDTWTAFVEIPQGGRSSMSVTATLRRASDPATVYREVSIQIALDPAPSVVAPAG
jgi:uncharacterized membrane protein